MNLTSVFLGPKGLSQSEANHTANIAKEVAQRISDRIASVSLFKETIVKEKTPYNFVSSEPELEKLCKEEGAIYALSSWLREGIKAKAALIQRVEQADSKTLGFALPERPVAPELGEIPSPEDVLNKLTIAERAEYLKFEAVAAHIGKKVHPKGIFDQWRHAMKHTPPTYFVKGTTSDILISVERLYSQGQLDTIFFNLQKEYREAESKVNYYKAKVNNLLNEETARINGENAVILDKYRGELELFTNERSKLIKAAEAKRATLLREVSELKIVVPHDLEGVLAQVQEYSKK